MDPGYCHINGVKVSDIFSHSGLTTPSVQNIPALWGQGGLGSDAGRMSEGGCFHLSVVTWLGPVCQVLSTEARVPPALPATVWMPTGPPHGPEVEPASTPLSGHLGAISGRRTPTGLRPTLSVPQLPSRPRKHGPPAAPRSGRPGLSTSQPPSAFASAGTRLHRTLCVPTQLGTRRRRAPPQIWLLKLLLLT